MDRRIHEAVLKGDIKTFLRILEEEGEKIIEQKFLGSGNTVLHLAARFGHVDLVSEIVKLSPEMVSSENGQLETPLHEACKEGHVEITRLLLSADPWAVYKVSRRHESVMFAACERGRLEVVKHLLRGFPRLLMGEVDSFTSSLHAAASAGHTEVVKEIVKERPDFAWKKDLQGCSPLHLACSKGHLDVTRELLRLDPDLSSLADNEGRTPLHWAAIKGRVSIMDEILSNDLLPGEMITKNQETVLHLAVKNNQYEAVRYLMETLNVTKLINLPDSDGNTILHLATAGKLTGMIIYLLKLGVDVNALNHRGFTALDVVESDSSNSGALAIVPVLQEAGARRCDQLPPKSQEIQQVIEPKSFDKFMYSPQSVQQRRQKGQSHKRSHRARAKQLEMQNEGLRNARKTITVVAVLISTVTFAAGINPPGGFSQETGKAIRGRKTAFKVFMVSNIVALFLSLGIVNVLVSIIPFKRKTMMNLLIAMHKVMWVSTLFMACAYVAAVWTIMPQVKGTVWVSIELICIGGGCTFMVFLIWGAMLGKHWYRKWEWRRRRREKTNKDGSPTNSDVSRVEELVSIRKGCSESTSNSDVDSSDHGYHLY